MIPIHNLYYMLSYAFKTLQEQGYRNLATEEFHNTADLFAAILSKGISVQLKRGLGQEYIHKTEPLSTLRGKMDISSSLKTQSLLKKQLICTYDDFSVNTQNNRILKTTLFRFLKQDISLHRKKEIRKLLVFFSDVQEIDLHSVQWNQTYSKNNQSYRMLISICYLVYKGLLQGKTDGNTKMMDFLDEQRMCDLYEKFLLEYYRKEHPELSAVASHVPWQLDDDMGEMLPQMKTDITLTEKDNPNKVLIIDAKYYEHSTQTNYGVHTLRSENLYQIFTYVKNKDYLLRDVPHSVSGMLLYAKTDEAIVPENRVYQMSGNQITVTSLDLNCTFVEIRRQLDQIVDSHFGVNKI